MKVLLNDGLDQEGIDLFHKHGIETDARKRGLVELIDNIPEFDALVVRSATQVTPEVIRAGSEGLLKVIGRAGVGIDNIDEDATDKHYVVIKYAPSGSTNAVAEHTIGLMLAISRNIPQSHYVLRNGLWVKKQFMGSELSNKILGVIGCGRIGQKLSQIASLAFGMSVLGYDENPDNTLKYPDSRIRYTTREEVISQADYLSIHTGGGNVIIGPQELASMKRKAYLINTSRGPNVDEDALYHALQEKKIAGAALDVFVVEPQEGERFSNRFQQLENVVLTSHLAASTQEAQRKTSIEIAQAISEYLVGENIFMNSVNVGETIASEKRRTYRLFITHDDIPGAFHQIDGVLSQHDVNIRDNPSRQFGRNRSVITVYRVHQPITPEVLRDLKKLDIVYRATL